MFNKVIKPNAAQYPQEVISPAIRGKYSPAHRAILAINALSTGDLLGPAWEGAEAPAQLDLAIGIYNHLIDPKVGRGGTDSSRRGQCRGRTRKCRPGRLGR